jgi:hypothetical protein
MQMTDPKTITDLAALGATAWASKELAGKLLGPTFEYIGGEVRAFTEKCNINLTDIFARARRKLGERIDTPGGVGARVLKDVLDQGAFCDDSVAAEYVAGVLAAARTDNESDDRGVTYLAVIRQLSGYQLRAHYLIYSSVKALLDGRELNILNFDDAPHARIFLPMAYLRDNLHSHSEPTEVVFTHVLNGLARQDLIDAAWWGGDEEVVRAGEPGMTASGYFVQPTGFGVELFLWAHGLGHRDVPEFLLPELTIDPLPDFGLRGTAQHSPDMSRERELERIEQEQRQRENDRFVRETIARRRGY